MFPNIVDPRAQTCGPTNVVPTIPGCHHRCVVLVESQFTRRKVRFVQRRLPFLPPPYSPSLSTNRVLASTFEAHRPRFAASFFLDENSVLANDLPSLPAGVVVVVHRVLLQLLYPLHYPHRGLPARKGERARSSKQPPNKHGLQSNCIDLATLPVLR